MTKQLNTLQDFDPDLDGCGPDCVGDHDMDYCCRCSHFTHGDYQTEDVIGGTICVTQSPCGDTRCCIN